MNAGGYVTVYVEVICLSIDFDKVSLILISSGIVPLSIPESLAVFGGLPHTVSLTGFIELIGYATACIVVLTGDSSIVSTEVMPCTVDLDPAALESTAYGVVVLTVHFKQSGNIISLIASGANKLTVNKLIAVPSCRSCRTPINDRLAICTVCSAGITGFRAGSFLIVKGCNTVRMIRRSTACTLNRGSNGCLGRSERTHKITCCIYSICIFDCAGFYIINDVYDRIITTGNCNRVRPYSYGNGCYDGRAGGRRISGLFDREIKQMSFFVELCVKFETGCRYSILILKCVRTVEIYSTADLADLFNIGCGKVKPVYRAVLRGLSVAGAACYRNGGISAVCRSYVYLLCDFFEVSFLVGNRKSNVMDAVCQDNFTGNHLAAGSVRADRIAVNIDLCCGVVQAGIVLHTGSGSVFSDFCREHCVVCGDGVSVKCGNISRTGVNFAIADDRHIAVAYDSAVVERYIINEERDIFIEFVIGMYNKLNSSGIQIVSAGLSDVMHIACEIGGRNISIYIYPSALGDTSICHTIISDFLVFDPVTRLGSHHDLAVLSCPSLSAVRTVCPKDTGADKNGILGDIHPHTETTAGISVCYVAQNPVIVDNVKIDQMSVPPAAAGSVLCCV